MWPNTHSISVDLGEFSQAEYIPVIGTYFKKQYISGTPLSPFMFLSSYYLPLINTMNQFYLFLYCIYIELCHMIISSFFSLNLTRFIYIVTGIYRLIFSLLYSNQLCEYTTAFQSFQVLWHFSSFQFRLLEIELL